MKKVLIGLGCVAVIALCVYGYKAYQRSDAGIRSSIEDFCSYNSNPEKCVCFHTGLWIGFGREKIYKVVELMRTDSAEERTHFVHKLLQSGTEDEIHETHAWIEKNCADAFNKGEQE